ncbi:hypothetical protein Salat_2433000 [Sesamum alatum]|uniref:Uncharacterized protein n=1 Tax=Sesamum alatum TaxID=300844 RepID=A0AAE2CFF5_9LAMI|nr:hypothetical protein Salat_2433000 [Sesamum alatum]
MSTKAKLTRCEVSKARLIYPFSKVDVTIEEPLEITPTTHWSVRQGDETLVCFGRLRKCFDLVLSLGLDYRPGLLPAVTPLFGGYLCGGVRVVTCCRKDSFTSVFRSSE